MYQIAYKNHLFMVFIQSKFEVYFHEKFRVVEIHHQSLSLKRNQDIQEVYRQMFYFCYIFSEDEYVYNLY